jgi:hypothetical protein
MSGGAWFRPFVDLDIQVACQGLNPLTRLAPRGFAESWDAGKGEKGTFQVPETDAGRPETDECGESCGEGSPDRTLIAY